MANRFRAIRTNLATFLIALVPVFKSCPPCPICMPKYAAIFAFFGLKLANYSQYLIPLMLASMVVSLGSMYYQATKNHLKIHPFMGALTSCTLLIIFKYVFNNTWGTYTAMAGLFTSIVLHYQLLNKKSCNSKKCKSCCKTVSSPTDKPQS